MPGVVTYVTLASTGEAIDPPLLYRYKWSDRQPPTEETFEFVEIDTGGLPVFDFVTSRPGIGDDDNVYTSVGDDGIPRIDPDGNAPGTPASVSYDGEFILFTTEGA